MAISSKCSVNHFEKYSAAGEGFLRFCYASSDDAWELGLWGANLTDESYYEDAVIQSTSSRVSYADPRTFGIDFRLRL